jgi:hypothetical protein
MEPIDPKHIAAINERLAKDGTGQLPYGEVLPNGTRISWPLHPNGRLPERSPIFQANAELSRYDRFRGWLHEHSRAITWTLNIASVIMSVLALVLALLASGCSREQPIARQAPASQGEAKPETEPFEATDGDLDSPSSQMHAQANALRLHALAAMDASHTATDTAQPLRQAETRRVSFAGVAIAGSVPTVVQLSNKPCLTRYNMAPLRPTITTAERQALDAQGRIQRDWRWTKFLGIEGYVRLDTVEEVFCDPDFAMIRIPDAGTAVAFEVIRGMNGVNISRMFHRASFRTPSPAVALPVGLSWPRQDVGRFERMHVMVIGTDANGAEVFMLPDTRLVDLPRWVEP